MRLRALGVIAGVFIAAALVSTFVVRQLPREGDRSPVTGADVVPAAPAVTPWLAQRPVAADGRVQLTVTAGPEPLEGAEVVLYQAVAGGLDPIRFFRAGEGRTDRAGRVALAARPGTYLATARAPGLAPGRTLVLRPAGEETTLAELSLAPPERLALEVQGGRPPAGTRVRLAPVVEANGWVLPVLPAEELAAVAGLAPGRSQVEGLAPGLYRVDVEAPGLHPVTVARVAVPRAAPLAATLEPLGAITGAVEGPATVRAVSHDHSVSAAVEGGRFSLQVPAGHYHVTALRAGGAPLAAAAAGVAVGPGAEARVGELRLAPAATLAGSASADGKPLAGAAVQVVAHGTAAVVARATSDAAGQFTVGDLAPGSYDVVALAPGRSAARVEGITLAAGARFPVPLALPAPGGVEGVVRDAAGKPLAGARVLAVSGGDGLAGALPLEARADFEGAFQLPGVEAGRAELVALQDGVLLGDAHAVRIAPGATARVDFTLAAPGVLAGKVTRTGGGVLGAAVVVTPLRPGLAPQTARALPDASGNFQLMLPAGEYRVLAGPAERSGSDLRVTPVFARVAPGETTRLDVPLTDEAAQGGPELLVLEPGGAPSPGAMVTVSRPDDPKVAIAAAAGDDGRVALGTELGLAGRAVTLRAHNGGRSGAVTTALPASGAVVVQLAPGAGLVGEIRAAQGAGAAPVKGFTLEVATQPLPGGWRTLDTHRFAGDHFEVADVPPEPLRVTAWTDDGRRGQALVTPASGESRSVVITLGAPGAGL